MNQMKPILFNTEMVQAIDNGLKCVTRRLVSPQPEFRHGETGTPEILDDGNWTFMIDQYESIYDHELVPKYQVGDILYVRETWRVLTAHRFDSDVVIGYKAKPGYYSKIVFPGSMSQTASRDEYDEFIGKWCDDKWHPSIFMPKEAARLFLEVTDVYLARLNDMEEEDAILEGFPDLGVDDDSPLMRFSTVWDKTLKGYREIIKHGWFANPWVWVYHFRKLSPEEGKGGAV